MVQHIRWTALWGRDFTQIGTEFKMIQRVEFEGSESHIEALENRKIVPKDI